MEENENEKKGKEEAPPPLPLGWTQIKRKRPAAGENSNAADEIDWCCDDPNCTRTARPSVTEVETAPENAVTIKGHAIFCLHEMDPDWFQGYLQIEGQRKPLGLLAIQETLDECLECKDGGYRQVTVKVFPYNKSKEPHEFKNVEWTGGDMMRLEYPGKVSMDTHCFWTGNKAVPYVEKYFGSLMKKLCENPDDSVLDTAPDLAIVTGPMTLTLLQTPTSDESAADDSGAKDM